MGKLVRDCTRMLLTNVQYNFMVSVLAGFLQAMPIHDCRVETLRVQVRRRRAGNSVQNAVWRPRRCQDTRSQKLKRGLWTQSPLSISNKVLPLQVRQIRKWLWEEHKYQNWQKLRNINTLELQYKALWRGSRHSCNCNVYTTWARRVGILRRLKKKLQPSTFKKFTLELFARSWSMHVPFGVVAQQQRR